MQRSEKGEWALVTGASEGLGREFAKQLQRRGFKVYAVARNEERLQSLMMELGEGHKYLVADLSRWDDTERVMDLLKNGSFRLLINNAGFGMAGAFQEMSLQRQLNMIRVNIDAVTSFSHTFLQQARHGDALINVSSVIGLMPYPAQAVYAATKAYVTSLTESLWQRSYKKGIYVQNLCPGSTETKFFERSRGRSPDKKLFQTAQQVVDTSLMAWDRNEGGTIISGGKNKMFANLIRAVPRRVTARITGGLE